jgi:hypothetical protein
LVVHAGKAGGIARRTARGVGFWIEVVVAYTSASPVYMGVCEAGVAVSDASRGAGRTRKVARGARRLIRVGEEVR